MHVARIGFTPVKGGLHAGHRSVLLTTSGPRGDRTFCLVDAVAARCLRTVENPALLRSAATWDGTSLSVRMPSGTVAGEPTRTGEVRSVDYWGRTALVELVEGPWAAAYSALLGRDVVLALAPPGEVVYGGAVTLVTRGSLAALADEVGSPVAGARFRATFELDAPEVPPYAEEDWVGRRLLIGRAELQVRGVVPRCAVVDLDPTTGTRNLAVTKVLGRRRPGDLAFGIDAEVTAPGVVDVESAARVGD